MVYMQIFLWLLDGQYLLDAVWNILGGKMLKITESGEQIVRDTEIYLPVFFNSWDLISFVKKGNKGQHWQLNFFHLVKFSLLL